MTPIGSKVLCIAPTEELRRRVYTVIGTSVEDGTPFIHVSPDMPGRGFYAHRFQPWTSGKTEADDVAVFAVRLKAGAE